MSQQPPPAPELTARGRVLCGVLLCALLVVLLDHGTGVLLDFVAAIRDPLQLDYGEGIVWQQALFIPGPGMYRNGTDLPFIVFHYPPLYYLLVRAAMLLRFDVLATGRAVSIVCGVVAAALVGGVVLATVGRKGQRTPPIEVGIAAAMALLALELHGFRLWTTIMRVDMPGIMFAMAGLLVGIRADGRFRGTAVALLLCVAAVYSKQTLLPAGIAVFAVALLRNPRGAIGAALVAGGTGLAVLGVLQFATDGGFLHHILGNNINRLSIRRVYWVLIAEVYSLPFMALMVVAFVLVLGTVAPSAWRLRPGAALREVWALRRADAPIARRAMLLLHFALSSLFLATLLKAGGNVNYLLEWFCSGCALVGVLLIDLARAPGRAGWLAAALVGLVVFVALQPARLLRDHPAETDVANAAAMVARIAAADKPVASENMTLLMRAGKPVIFEPSIVTELASVGRWDEAPLLAMFRTRGFAFVITVDNEVGGNDRRTPGVDAAMRDGYPEAQHIGPGLWLHLPPP